MDFYTSLFLGTVAFLIIILLVFGYYMSIYNKNVTYPPIISDCPDNYTLDNSFCISNPNVSNFILDPSCNNINFLLTPYTNTGSSYESGKCKKKLWAQSCSVDWDGISNDHSLCYN